MLTPQTSTIITVTGTKGKTSVTRALHYVINTIENTPVLRADTNSVVVGLEKKFGLNASRHNAGFVPSVCPGRFLALISDQKEQIAVLEASVGCARTGLGYGTHNVGIFTNVYDDHIGAADYLKNRQDLANAKASFIFGNIRSNGTAVFNYDDELVRERATTAVSKTKAIKKIACTLFDDQKVSESDTILTIRNEQVVIINKGQTTECLSITDTPWLLEGKHTPTLYNALFVIGALWAQYGHQKLVFENAISVLKAYMPDEKGGRMVLRTADTGTKILLDYAHERESLTQIALYAKSLLGIGGKIIGVVRLDNSRPDYHVEETARQIAQYYDELIVYDKEISRGITTLVSATTEAMLDGAIHAGAKAKIIALDHEALVEARAKASPRDVIVYIISNTDASYKLADEVFNFKESI